MRPNLINRLKEEWNNLDPVDPLRGLLSDAIDALADQPAQVDGDTIVQTFTGLPRRKLRDLLSGGWELNGVCFQRIETDGTVRRGAATTGGMVLWWNAEQPAQRTWVGLTDDEILYCVELENPKAIAEEVEAKLREKNQ